MTEPIERVVVTYDDGGYWQEVGRRHGELERLRPAALAVLTEALTISTKVSQSTLDAALFVLEQTTAPWEGLWK
ncbi:MAG: hypothetical protein C4523_19670 [Myxococcales bacterium]|nr:MAG: hypothetical protein C4523_19670 [Myxococcales bacterium]